MILQGVHRARRPREHRSLHSHPARCMRYAGARQPGRPAMRPTATARAMASNRAWRPSTSAGRRSTKLCGAAPGRLARTCRARRWV